MPLQNPEYTKEGNSLINNLTGVDAHQAQQEAATSQEGKQTKQKDGIRNSAVTAALISAAKQAAMQGVNKYAELSGNYNVTDNLSLVLEGASMVAMMFAGPSWLDIWLVQ